jgi:hypothetical protein
MSKKTLILIGLVMLGLVLVLGGLFVYLNTSSKAEGTTTVAEALQKLNPFGDGGIAKVGKNIVDTIDNTNILNINTSSETTAEYVPQPALFKLSDERSSGIGFAEVLIPKTVEVRRKITIDDPTVASSSKPRKISVMATTTETAYSTTTRIRFVEQGSGHIYEQNYASSTTRKLTNTTIPKTQEAYFLDNGNKVLLRYLDAKNKTVENYLATIPVSSVPDTLTGSFLSGNIKAISVSPSTTEFFYLAKTAVGSIGNIYNTKTASERRVFSSEFSEWLPAWVGSSIFVTTKAASSVQGYTYSQSLTKNTLSRVTGNKLGLTSLPSPDGNKVLLGEGLRLSILTVSTGQIVQIPTVYTVPEKCTWVRDVVYCFGSETITPGNFPDIWYQGKQNLSDALYSINTITGTSYLLATMPELYTKGDIFIDAVNPLVSKDYNTLVFINKLDMTPWYINLRVFEGL